MNRADLMLSVLQDGRKHSRHDIFNAAGKFFLTNNAASELRERGYVIEQERDGSNVLYRLVGNLNDIPLLSEGSAEPASARPGLSGPSLSNGSEPLAGAVGNTAVAQLTLEDAA